MATSSNQPTRLILLLIYVAALFAVSRFALGSLLPPTTEKGLWFYAGLIALLLGNLLVNPFFTKPADALAYSVSGGIALLSVNPWYSNVATEFDQLLWTGCLSYLVFIALAAIFSIALKDSAGHTRRKVSSSLYLVGDLLGGPRAVCSAVFLYALISFHRTAPREYLWIGAAWVLLIALRPLEAIVELWIRLRAIWRVSSTATRLGLVVGHELPNISLICEDDVAPAGFGTLLLTRLDTGAPGLAMAIDHVGYAEGRWLRAVELPTPLNAEAQQLHKHLLGEVRRGAAFCVGQLGAGFDPPDKAWVARQRLLGVVAPETSVDQLHVDIARADTPLRQGSIVEVGINGRDVLYQIIGGLTEEEILQTRNKRGYVRARARKIGCWHNNAFESLPWLPQPNDPVFLMQPAICAPNRDSIGNLPGTELVAKIDCQTLVTHNAAILGILGVGKTFLALELIERMLADGIKVICLDLTDQYAQQLTDFHDSEAEAQEASELREIGKLGKKQVNQNVEEGGSANKFTEKLTEQLRAFLAPEGNRKLKILNPNHFEVWRQDSKPYQNNASMASLTPCEITRIISEATLEVVQGMGIAGAARCCLVYEEAHTLIPEWNAVASDGDKTATNGTAKAILQGRKFGLGCLVITQRTANVTKTILNQCNTVFALRVFDATGIEFLSNYIGEDYAKVLSSLEDRHAVVFGRASSCKEPVLLRLNDREAFLEVFRPQPAAAAVA